MPFLMVSPTRRCMYMVTAWHMHGSILVPFTSMIFRAQYGEKRIGDASDKSLCEMFNTTRPEINYIRFMILHFIISLVLNASHYSAIFQNLEHSSIHIWRYSAVAAGRQSASAIPVNHTTHVSKETLRKKTKCSNMCNAPSNSHPNHRVCYRQNTNYAVATSKTIPKGWSSSYWLKGPVPAIEIDSICK